MGLEECSSCIPTHCFSLSLSLFVCLCVVLHFSWFNMCFSKPPNFKWRMKILWESKESGWKNVDHAFQHIVSLSLLFCPILVSKCVSSKPPNFKWKTKILWESIDWGWKKGCCWSCFLTHYCLSPSSISNFSDYKKHGAKLQNSNGKWRYGGTPKKECRSCFPTHSLCVLSWTFLVSKVVVKTPNSNRKSKNC